MLLFAQTVILRATNWLNAKRLDGKYIKSCKFNYFSLFLVTFMINIHPPVILVSSNEVCSTINYYRHNLVNVVEFRLHLFGVERGFIEGSLRVHWGLGGENLYGPSINPLYTLFEMSIYCEWIAFKFRIYSREMNREKHIKIRSDLESTQGSI